MARYQRRLIDCGWASIFEPFSNAADLCKFQIFVDRKAQTVILPVHGFAVPFHINTIKNASKSDEGDFTYLRINFQTPGQLAGKKEDTVSSLFQWVSRCFIVIIAVRGPRCDFHSFRLLSLTGWSPSRQYRETNN